MYPACIRVLFAVYPNISGCIPDVSAYCVGINIFGRRKSTKLRIPCTTYYRLASKDITFPSHHGFIVRTNERTNDQRNNGLMTTKLTRLLDQVPIFSYAHRSASLPVNFEDEETHHNIDRFTIAEVICRECHTRQSSKTNNCVNCNVQFGAYHCNICNLWMTVDEFPYHCVK